MQNTSVAGGQPSAAGPVAGSGSPAAEAPFDLNRLVTGIAGRLFARLPRGCGIEMADLIQAGNVGLLKAERAYEPSSGIPLGGYAKFRIRGEMLDMIRRYASRRLVLASDRDTVDEGEHAEWLACVPAPAEASPHSTALRQQRSAILREEIRRLPDRYRKVVSMRYSGELTLRQIGAELSVNESRASQIHRLALTRLRQALSSRGLRAMSQVL
ncbi:MAG TPA: sigma-70 family RNA polymerase sigma factor [Bryobacteraceae bacterium]|nr:sigma-70 family RNA polymerase sigma factor [Bryobacteraceae bacterium]